jgi:hypothetical protein
MRDSMTEAAPSFNARYPSRRVFNSPPAGAACKLRIQNLVGPQKCFRQPDRETVLRPERQSSVEMHHGYLTAPCWRNHVSDVLKDGLTLILSSNLAWNRAQRESHPSTCKNSAQFALILRHDQRMFRYLPQSRTKVVTQPFKVLPLEH